jgi:hypothetical protein
MVNIMVYNLKKMLKCAQNKNMQQKMDPETLPKKSCQWQVF